MVIDKHIRNDFRPAAVQNSLKIWENPIVMNEFINEFINYLSVERGLANNTLLAYRRDLKKYSQYLKSPGGIHQVSREGSLPICMIKQKGCRPHRFVAV